MNGEGSCLWPDGTQYQGMWLDGCRHGNGTLWWNNGTTVEAWH